VSPPVELIAVLLLPTAAVYALLWGARLLRWAAERRTRPPAAEPIERLTASLRRLRSELEAMETQAGLPAKNLRLRALKAAYVDALCTACQRLEITPPADGGPARSGDVALTEIYRVEAALRQHGLDVRETADR
jgi:HAMP domain-containing protein